MNAIRFLLLVLVLAPTVASAEPAVVRTFEAKIYSTASTSGWVVGELKEGDKVSVSEESIGGFRRVRLKDGSTGYVEERVLALTNAPGAAAGAASGVAAAAGPAPVAPAKAPAPAPPPESKARRHKGFFLRLDGGIGYASSSASVTGYSASISGASSQFGLAIGGGVVENVLAGGEVWGGVMFSPTVQVNGRTGTGSASAALIGFGPHISFYFMPANVYLALTPSVTVVSLTANGTSASTKAGFGAKIGLGKEWWVGDRWGLGLAAQFLMSFNVDTGTNPPTWATFGGGLSFTTTFN